MKIVISSNINYTKPLNILLKQLKNTHYKNSIIVVVTDCPGPDIIKKEDMITYIKTSENNYEYTSYNMIKKYLFSHPDILENTYLFMHDTCVIGPNFGTFFEQNPLNNNELITYPARCSNIMYIHVSVFHNFNHMYSELSKKDACDLENNIEIRGMKNVTCYADVRLLDERLTVGLYDVYNTGYERYIRHYPEFDIYKATLHNKYGDFTNCIKNMYTKSKRKRHIIGLSSEIIQLFQET